MAVSQPLPTTPRDARAEEELPKMSFGDHLEELRRRLIVSAVAVLVCVLGLMPFKSAVTEFYVLPYKATWTRLFADHCAALQADVEARLARGDTLHKLKREQHDWVKEYAPQILGSTFPSDMVHSIPTYSGFPMPPTLVALGGLEDFWTFMSAAMLIGLVIAAPIVLYQAWAFVAAGLYKHERRVVLRYFPFALGLLATGVVFGFMVVVPWGLYFLLQMMNFFGVVPMFSVAQYFSLLLTLTAALGIVFQLPLVMLALQKVGIATFHGMRKSWRYVILGIFVTSAIVTPSPDPFTQLMMALPMCLLYVVGLLLCWRASRRG